MVQRLEEKPPFVRFELRSFEDRNASIEAGHPVYTDKVLALITPRGSKDIHEELAEDWFPKMRQEVKEERFPAEWLQQYETLYKNYKLGIETPEDGLSLRNWPGILPAQLRVCHAIHIYTVEQLAAANEEAILSLGMGGRSLRDKAKEYLSAAAGPGAHAAKIVALQQQNEELQRQNTELRVGQQTLVHRLEALEQRPSGVPSAANISDDTKISISELLAEPSKQAAHHARKL